MMTVYEAIPNRSLVWEVVEANDDREDLKRKDEWKDNTIKWEMVETEMGAKVNLTHQGLIQVLECNKICQAGWTIY